MKNFCFHSCWKIGVGFDFSQSTTIPLYTTYEQLTVFRFWTIDGMTL